VLGGALFTVIAYSRVWLHGSLPTQPSRTFTVAGPCTCHRSAINGWRSSCGGIRRSYAHSMKTAVSHPDAVFLAAERQAKRARKSHSQLTAEALAEYLSRHAPEDVTEAMNHVVDQLGIRSCTSSPRCVAARRMAGGWWRSA